MEALTDLPFELVIHRMRENRGNAGGVEEAMELAFAKGADAVWILDDDSWPRADALEAMLEKAVGRRGGKTRPANRPSDGSFHLADVGSERKWLDAGVRIQASYRKGLRSQQASWTGALVSKRIREAVGPVNGDLFIRGEDEEYPWRIVREGFRFVAVRDAVMDHPGRQNLIHWQFFGKNFFFERGLADWKLYYKVRNMVWLKRRQAGPLRAITMALTYALAAAWIDGIQRLPLIWQAAHAGWHGKLGKREFKENEHLAHRAHDRRK